MKSSKIYLVVLLFTSLIYVSCSKCKNEDPAARITNKGSEKASVQIKTSGGNTVNINNVDPNMSSPYSSYAQGTVTFTITIATIDYVETVNMVNCYDYDIIIDTNNVITTVVTNRND